MSIRRSRLVAILPHNRGFRRRWRARVSRATPRGTFSRRRRWRLLASAGRLVADGGGTNELTSLQPTRCRNEFANRRFSSSRPVDRMWADLVLLFRTSDCTDQVGAHQRRAIRKAIPCHRHRSAGVDLGGRRRRHPEYPECYFLQRRYADRRRRSTRRAVEHRGGLLASVLDDSGLRLPGAPTFRRKQRLERGAPRSW